MHRESGAVHVHVFWLIFFFLIAAAGWAAFMVQSDARAAAESDWAGAIENEKKALDRIDELAQETAAISQVVGFRDPDDALSNTVRTVIEGQIQNLRDAHPTIVTEEKTTLQDILPSFVAAFDQQRQLVTAREGDITNREGQITSLEASRDQIQTDLQQQIRDKDSQLQAANARADQQERDLQARIDDLRQREQQLEGEVTNLKAEHATQVEEMTSNVRDRDARIAGQAAKLRILYPEDKPDGAVIDADPRTMTAFVDIGRRDGAQEGLRFTAYHIGKGGVREPKGTVKVSEVFDTYSKAIIETPQDRFEPMGKGDILVNPLFDRDRSKIFVFVGRFPGRYNQEQLKLMIAAAGGEVRTEVGADTDFLIVGEVGDPTLEEGEAQIDPTQTQEYQKALRYGVQILSANDVIRYVRS